MWDALARRYPGFKGPFDPELRRQVSNPYKRYFFQAAIEALETNDVLILKTIEQWFKFLIDYLGDMTDLLGTSNINVHVDRKHHIRSLFSRRERLLDSEQAEQYVRYIPGVGGVKILPMEYED